MVTTDSTGGRGALAGWWEGQRVVDEEGYRGTVRYIGPVATAKDPESIWIGKKSPRLLRLMNDFKQ